MYLYTNNIAYIIDHGKCHIKYKGRDYGISGFEKYGASSKESFPLYDAYKLLCFSMRTALNNNDNKDLFETLSKLFRYFDPTDDPRVAIVEQDLVNYILPRKESLTKRTLSDFIDYVLDAYNINFIDIVPINDAYVLNCSNVQCENEADVKKELNVDDGSVGDIIELLHKISQNPITEVDNNQYYKLLPQFVVDISKLHEEMVSELNYVSNQKYVPQFHLSNIAITELRGYVFDVIELGDVVERYNTNVNIFLQCSIKLNINTEFKIDVNSVSKYLILKKKLSEDIDKIIQSDPYKLLKYDENPSAYIFYKRMLPLYKKLI
jgi:hypothetical protein